MRRLQDMLPNDAFDAVGAGDNASTGTFTVRKLKDDPVWMLFNIGETFVEFDILYGNETSHDIKQSLPMGLWVSAMLDNTATAGIRTDLRLKAGCPQAEWPYHGWSWPDFRG